MNVKVSPKSLAAGQGVSATPDPAPAKPASSGTAPAELKTKSSGSSSAPRLNINPRNLLKLGMGLLAFGAVRAAPTGTHLPSVPMLGEATPEPAVLLPAAPVLVDLEHRDPHSGHGGHGHSVSGDHSNAAGGGNSTASGDGGLSTGTKAGIGVTAGVAAAAVASGVYMLHRSRRNKLMPPPQGDQHRLRPHPSGRLPGLSSPAVPAAAHLSPSQDAVAEGFPTIPPDDRMY